MATKVHMEALSPTMEEGQLVRWLKKEGDAIKEGDVLAEIETDKATMELVARGSGVLSGVKLKEGDTAPVGEVIAMIGEAPAAQEPSAQGSSTQEPSAEAPAAQEPSAEGSSAQEPSAQEPSAEAPSAQEPSAQEPSAEGSSTQEPSAEEPSAQAASAQGAAREAPSAQGDGRVKASPLARRLAEEKGLDLSVIEGTGPGGRIIRRDIEGAETGAGAGTETETGTDAGAAAPRVDTGADSEEVPVTQMRKAIAKRLAQSIGPIPTFYLTIECDMTRLMELRTRVNSALEKDGIKTSINDFVIKSVATALARHPEVNASWGDGVITRHHRVHIGVAVAVEDGLITPIVRDADRKRVRDIAGEVKELAGRAREKKLKPEEYTGATFSISNLGMFGIVEFTAIINPPEAAILAVGAVEEKPVVVDGQVRVQQRMRMTMSCDHRVIDGATGAKFLQTVQEMIEDPMMMLA